jgi:hypothetical protein
LFICNIEPGIGGPQRDRWRALRSDMSGTGGA